MGEPAAPPPSRRERLRAPTMADVAAVAGVSAQTVSRVLRGYPHVSEVARMQVEAAVERTGYRRTLTARALVTGRSMTIGVLTHETDYYARSALMLGVQQATRERGYVVSAAGTDSLSPAAIHDAIDHLRTQGVDGFVVAVPIWDEAALSRSVGDRPFVVVDSVRAASGDRVMVDQPRAGELATRHLLELGHETVWHVSGPTSWKDAAGRTTGWQRTLEDAGRPVPPPIAGDWSPESGHRAGLLLARMGDVSAVFVSSDEMAFGVLHALREQGRRVPQDVSVVGMDDIALARYAAPPLTTVRQPFRELGRAAAEHVVAMVEAREQEHETLVLPPQLVVRESTATPAGPARPGRVAPHRRPAQKSST